MSLAECKTAADVYDNYRAVRARMNALKSWTPPVVVEMAPPKVEPKPVPRRLPLLPTHIRKPRYAIEVDPAEPPPLFPRVSVIQQTVCETHGITLLEMLSGRRHARLVRPRHFAIYLCRTLTPHSWPEIGRRFGNRDHTTVMHAVRKIARLRVEDERLDAELRALEEKLTVEKHEATPTA